MFEIIAFDGRTVIDHAQRGARLRRQDHIGTEHLLLGLAQANGVAKRAIVAAGISDVMIGNAIDATVRIGSRPSPDRLRLAPTTSGILAQAQKEAERLGDDAVHTEHILLSLLKQKRCVALRVLDSLDISQAYLKRMLVGVMDGFTGQGAKELADFRRCQTRERRKETA